MRARRKSILVYPDAKIRFDEVHRELRSEGATQTLEALISFFREHNQRVTV